MDFSFLRKTEHEKVRVFLPNSNYIDLRRLMRY